MAIAVSYLAIYIKVWQVRRNLRRSAYAPITIMNESDPLSVGNGSLAPTVICMRMKRFEHRVKGAKMMFICFSAFCITYYPAVVVVSVAAHMQSQILLKKPPLLLWFFGLYFTGCCVNPVSLTAIDWRLSTKSVFSFHFFNKNDAKIKKMN